MFTLSTATRVYLYAGATDMRKSFNGLVALVENKLKEDPLSGHLFVFCNHQKNRLKVLFWDGSGLWVCAKRLERGRFDWPASGSESAALSLQELTWLLEGMSMSEAKKKPWFRLRRSV